MSEGELELALYADRRRKLAIAATPSRIVLGRSGVEMQARHPADRLGRNIVAHPSA
jgi:hypothetical protein